MFYAGDEYYDDDVTSGMDPDDLADLEHADRRFDEAEMERD